MSNYDNHNQAFDYAPPRRGGSGYGALMVIGGIVVLFILGMVLLSPGDGTVTSEGAAPSVAPVDGAPITEPSTIPAPSE